jgi:hypothetical protein
MMGIVPHLVVFVFLYLPAGAIVNLLAVAVGVAEFDFLPSLGAAVIIRLVMLIWVWRAP